MEENIKRLKATFQSELIKEFCYKTGQSNGIETLLAVDKCHPNFMMMYFFILQQSLVIF